MLHRIYKTLDAQRGFDGRLAQWMADEKIADGVVGDVNGIYFWRGEFDYRLGQRLKDMNGTVLTPRAQEMMVDDVFKVLARDKRSIQQKKRSIEREDHVATPKQRDRDKVVSLADSPLGRDDAGRWGVGSGVGYGNR